MVAISAEVRRKCRQNGIALLALLLILVLAGSALFLSYAHQGYTKPERDAQTVTVLAQVKEALIARAVTDANRPGSLPCPASDGNGIAPLLIGSECPSYTGWLPWRTLDIPDLRDDSGERLWYILDRRLRDATSAQPINSTVTTNLTLDGSGGIAALIIAPGRALAGQDRTVNSLANYLDGSNSDGDNAFVSGPASDTFNDRVMALDNTTLFAAVSRRILGELRAAVVAAGGTTLDADSDGDGHANPGVQVGRFPYLDYYPPLPNFLNSNGWYTLVTYNRSAKTLSLNGLSVTLP
jgi:hypothetical protein